MKLKKRKNTAASPLPEIASTLNACAEKIHEAAATLCHDLTNYEGQTKNELTALFEKANQARDLTKQTAVAIGYFMDIHDGGELWANN